MTPATIAAKTFTRNLPIGAPSFRRTRPANSLHKSGDMFRLRRCLVVGQFEIRFVNTFLAGACRPPWGLDNAMEYFYAVWWKKEHFFFY